MKLAFEKRDAWIGVYVSKDTIYVCPLPFLVVKIRRRHRLKIALYRAFLACQDAWQDSNRPPYDPEEPF